MAFLSSLADWGNKAVDWYKDNPIVSDVLVPGGLSLYNTSQQKNAISGATGQRTAGIEQGLASLNQFYGTARQDAAPYMQGGLQGLGQYQALLADPNAVKESEDYKFRFGEGQQALERSAAAKGMLLSGNTLQDLQQYGQGFATRELDAALQRRIPLIETGLTSQQSLSALGGDYARAIASLYGDKGEAEAQGTLRRSTATTGTLSDTFRILEGLGTATDIVDMATTGAQKLGSYLGLGGNAAPLAAAGLGGTGLAGLGTTAGTAASLGTGGFGAGLGAAGLGGTGLGGAATLPGMGGTTAAFEGMTSGIGAGVGTGGSTAAASGATAGSIGLLGSLGIGAGIIGIGKALQNIKGGAAEEAKTGKLYKDLQARSAADPTGQSMYARVDNLIENRLWPNEGNGWVIGDLINNNVISVDYPKLHSSQSVVDLWNVTPDMVEDNGAALRAEISKGDDRYWDRATGRQRKETQTLVNSTSVGPKALAATYGLSPEQQQQYEDLVSAAKRSAEFWSSPDAEGNGIVALKTPKPEQAQAQLDQFKAQYMTEARKKAYANSLYSRLRASGYTGDLAKLEKYIGS